MPTSHRRRVLALSASGGLVTALAWLPAGPASAAAPPAVYIAQASSSADSGCTAPTGTDFNENGPNNLHNGRGNGSVSLVTNWTSTTDSTDVTNVTGHYGGSTHLVKQHGAFRTATVSGSGHITITRALGNASTCHASARFFNAVEFITKQPAGWYYVTRNTIKNSLTETVVAPGTTLVKPVIFETYQGGKNTVTQRAFVTKGTYVTALVAGIEAGDFTPLNTKSGVARVSTTNTMSAVFRNAGSALGRSRGGAGQFVKFPASVSCSHHSATLTWRSGASKVASGSFFVNGSKKASVSNPVAGRSVVLKHLSPTADNKITAKLSLKAGGHPTATGMYVPCKG